MSRSEFFSRAASRYLDEIDAQSLIVQIDAALERVNNTLDDGATAAVASGRRALQTIDDEW